MEEKKQELMPFQTTSIGIRNIKNELIKSDTGISLSEATDEEIAQCMSYGIILLGISSDKIPKSSIEDAILNNFLRKTYPTIKLNEIKTAFDYALEKRINVDLNMYGSSFSANYVSTILMKYVVLKKELLKKTEVGITNHESAGLILTKLKEKFPETYESLKNVGKIEEKKPVLPPIKNDDKWQKYLKEFTILQRDASIPDTNGRFVKYKKKIFLCTEYCEYRYNEELKNNK